MRKSNLLKKVAAVVLSAAMAVTMVPFVGGTKEVKAADVYTMTFSADGSILSSGASSYITSGTFTKSDYTFAEGKKIANKVSANANAFSIVVPEGYSAEVIVYAFGNSSTANLKYTVDGEEKSVAALQKPANGNAYSTCKLNSIEVPSGSYDFKFSAQTQVYEVDLNLNVQGTTYGISSSMNIEGAGTLSVPSKAPKGNVNISATSNPGYKFVNWTSTTTGVTFADATSATTTFTMPETAVSIVANFEVDNDVFDIVVTSEDEEKGTVECETAKAGNGTTITIKATPKTGYVFVGWESEDVTFAKATSASTTFTMVDKNVSVVAKFAKEEILDDFLDCTYSVSIAEHATGDLGNGFNAILAIGTTSDSTPNYVGKDGTIYKYNKASDADNMIKSSAGTNGDLISFTAPSNGTVKIAFIVNADKTASVFGETIRPSAKTGYYREYDVVAGQTYTAGVSGSKIMIAYLGFTPDTTPIPTTPADPTIFAQEKATTEGYSVRFVYEIGASDIENYTEVGVKVTDVATGKTGTIKGNKVYTSVKADGTEINSGADVYYVVCELTEVPANKTFTVSTVKFNGEDVTNGTVTYSYTSPSAN